jgi:hypothetical protein
VNRLAARRHDIKVLPGAAQPAAAQHALAPKLVGERPAAAGKRHALVERAHHLAREDDLEWIDRVLADEMVHAGGGLKKGWN